MEFGKYAYSYVWKNSSWKWKLFFAWSVEHFSCLLLFIFMTKHCNRKSLFTTLFYDVMPNTHKKIHSLSEILFTRITNHFNGESENFLDSNLMLSEKWIKFHSIKCSNIHCCKSRLLKAKSSMFNASCRLTKAFPFNWIVLSLSFCNPFDLCWHELALANRT
jgi:hypothetical protein